VKVNFTSLSQILFGLGVTFAVFTFVISFYKNQVMNILKEKMTMQDELGQILYNLDQSIISITDDKVSYINKVGQ
jgi:hypothetical protein